DAGSRASASRCGDSRRGQRSWSPERAVCARGRRFARSAMRRRSRREFAPASRQPVDALQRYRLGSAASGVHGISDGAAGARRSIRFFQPRAEGRSRVHVPRHGREDAVPRRERSGSRAPGDRPLGEEATRAALLRQPAQLLVIPHVEKVDLIGAQEEKVYVEFSDKKLAQLGLTAGQIAAALQSQNAVVPTGTVTLPSLDVPLRVTGRLDGLGAISGLALRLNGSDFRVRDLAQVRRGLVDPPDFKMRFNGKEVIGVGITMDKAGDVLQTGKEIERLVSRLRAELPQGIEIEQV